jgi:hypothetical protein
MDTEKEILDIKERNKKVESDKAWERSWVRRLSIAIFTYIIAEAWLLIISEPNSWLKAFVPVAGYILSTLSLPPIKKFWIKNLNN